MESLIDFTVSLGQSTDIIQIGKTLLIAAGIIVAVCFLFKLIFGKNSSLNRSVRAAIGILFVYICTILIYTFNPAGLASLLPPLPFLDFNGETAVLFPFRGSAFTVICHEILSMVLLAFVYHVIDDFMPKGVRKYWLLYRVLTVAMSLALHYFAIWAINTFLPSTLVMYAPTVLAVVLFLGLFMGLLKIVLGLMLTAVNPILGAVYGFFFASTLGKHVSKAVLTALLLSGLVYAIESFGYYSFSVGATALITYVPTLLVLLLVWYVAGLL